eukprot:8301960-Prorocentrum_lima.AAC.1
MMLYNMIWYSLAPMERKDQQHTQARIVNDRTTHSILQALQEIWIRPFGPPRIMECDQGGGLISDEAKVLLSRVGTTLGEKGVGPHARM